MFRQAFFYLGIRNSPWKDEDSLRLLQLRKLKIIVQHAYETTPFYRALFNEHSINPQDIHLLSDLNSIPIVSKDMIKDAGNRMISNNYPIDTLLSSKTSGTTGVPLPLYRSHSSMDLVRAAKYRTYVLNGFHPLMKTVYWLSKPQPRKLSHLIGMHREIRTERDLPIEQQVDFLKKHQADVFYCNPSHLANIATHVLDNNIDGIRPRIIFSESEELLPATRQLIKKGLRVDPINIYGSREIGCIAWECNHRNGLHINADLLLLEVINPETGKTVEDGSSGHVVITDFTNWAMPYIRYDTGDIATVTYQKCRCGITFPMLTEIIGRAGKIVNLPSGKQFTANFYFPILLRAVHEIEQYQVIITLSNSFIIKIKTTNNIKIDEDELKRKVSKRCEGMQTEIQYVYSRDEFAKFPSGKFIDYIHEKDIVK